MVRGRAGARVRARARRSMRDTSSHSRVRASTRSS
jgi:hypothetical protein